ncbi:MAG TPA: 16S rRNA (cytosine(1402)-N(4))-methyltransferase RsmH [Candidatus Eremiobacteraceae bacterium]|nr:16S rRNA (cytosine(1402)-N(4))-methyltransferase RsmH [Candidatus Eremiobacteraceae bacterium]
MLQSAGGGENKVFVDATFGAGGHAAALLDNVPNSTIVAIDADPAAVERARLMARRYPGRLIPTHANFGELGDALDRNGVKLVDGILYDLGLSSLQLADSSRGFSFAGDQPLDMRLDPASGEPSASDLLGTLPQAELERLLRDYGDERHARSISRSIVKRRMRVRRWRTGDLVAAVLSAQPSRSHQRIHPATRTFQALRVAVNHDVRNLERSLETAVRRLRPKGRLVVISFQSGEDRIVKHRFKAFQQAALATLVTRKPLRPSAREIAANARSRSAKLRAVERASNGTSRREN